MTAYTNDTLAEMHLLEYLENLLRIADDAVRSFIDAINNLKNDNVDYIKIHDKISRPKQQLEENRILFMEYLIRLGENLPNRSNYASIATGLERLVQLLEGAVYRLSLLRSSGYSIEDEIVKLLVEGSSNVRSSFIALTDAISKLRSEPKKTLLKVNEIIELENRGDDIYRKTTFTIYNKLSNQIVPLMVLRDVVDFIEDACDVIKDVGEELRYLALYRILIT